MPVQEVKGVPVWKVILNLVYAGLTTLKGMGMFSRKPGPKL
jgi:hypothetical protein